LFFAESASFHRWFRWLYPQKLYLSTVQFSGSRPKGSELCEKLFQEVKALLGDPETIRSVSTIKLT
jgi:hypothetical protein